MYIGVLAYLDKISPPAGCAGHCGRGNVVESACVHLWAAGRRFTSWSAAAGCYRAGVPSSVVTGSCLLRSPPIFPSWVYPGPLEQGWPLWLPSWYVSKVADTTVDGAVGRNTELDMSWSGKQGSTFSGPAERLSSDLSQEVPASPGWHPALY